VEPVMNGKRYLITGGTGFMGVHLCRHFLDGNEVLCLNGLRNEIPCSKDLEESYGFMKVSSQKDFSGIDIGDGGLDYILHFASYPSPKDHLAMPLESLTADCLGMISMVKLAIEKDAVLLLASTGHIDEERDPTSERSVYSEGKRFAEAYGIAAHRKLGLKIRIIRMFNSYGPGMRINDGRVVPTFIAKALRNELLNVRGGSQLMSLTYIDDMISAVEKVLYSDICEPMEVGSLHRIAVGELAKLIIKLCGSESKITMTSQQINDERLPDLQRAVELGWYPKIGIEEGLKRTINYFREKI